MKNLTKTLACAAMLIASSFVSATAYAEFPEKPITLHVAYRAGGGADTLARVVAQSIENSQGWTIVVKNTTGAGGGVMATKLKVAKPDGYTIGIAATSAFAMNPLLDKKPRYNAEDFTYFGTVAKSQIALVALADAPYNDLEEMAAYAKEHGALSIASMAKEFNVATDLIAKHYGIELKAVPVKGGAGSMQQLLGKHVDMGFGASVQTQYVKAGQMKVLASADGSRLKDSPEVKTLIEYGINADLEIYFQFQAPAGLPEDITQKLAAAIEQATKDPEVLSIVNDKLHLEAAYLGPQELHDYVLKRVENYQAMLAAAE